MAGRHGTAAAGLIGRIAWLRKRAPARPSAITSSAEGESTRFRRLFTPPEGAPEDARFAFLVPAADAPVGAPCPVRVVVQDATGAVDPITRAEAVSVVVREGSGEVEPASHLFRGEIVEDRYVRSVLLSVRSSIPGTVRLGLRDDAQTGLDAAAETVIRFHMPGEAPASGRAGARR